MAPVITLNPAVAAPSFLPLIRSAPNPYALLPSGAYDTHVHIFEPDHYPYVSTRAYSPAEASLEQLLSFSSNYTQDQLPTNLVLVQPSPYGANNSLLLHSLDRLGAIGCPHPRGIAVVDPDDATLDELQSMHRHGVRGLRVVSIIYDELTEEHRVERYQVERHRDRGAHQCWCGAGVSNV